MYNPNDNIGMVLAFNSADRSGQEGWARKGLKSLLICLVTHIFKQYCNVIVRKLPYLCTPKKLIVENKQTISDQWQMADILVANAELSAFVITMDKTTQDFINETVQKQDEVLKLKEVNEERLRMVVQL